MGLQMLNGVPYGSVRQIQELTQAEYNALPSSKYTDGILYCITDDGMVEGNKFAPVIYSTEEQEIGTWIDGRPLYVVTKDLPSATHDTWVVGATLDSECEIKIYSGFIIDSQYSQQFPIEGGFCYTNVNDYSGGNVGFNIFKFCPKQSLNAEGGKVTLYYTKSTDVPGSGKWSTYGVPNRHYSTEEQVIGTWIDGKPLYEKVFNGTLPSQTISNYKLSDLSSMNIDKMITVFGTLADITPINAYYGSNLYSIVFINSAKTGLYINGAGLNDGLSYEIILQYTKTTD